MDCCLHSIVWQHNPVLETKSLLPSCMNLADSQESKAETSIHWQQDTAASSADSYSSCGSGRAKPLHTGQASGVRELCRPWWAHSYRTAQRAILIWKPGGTQLFQLCWFASRKGSIEKDAEDLDPLLCWLNLSWFLTSFKVQSTFSWSCSCKPAIMDVTVCQDTVQCIGHVSFYRTRRRDEGLLRERKLLLTMALVYGFHRFN